jgi:hypothetical protein
MRDAALDANVPHLDATVADSFVAADQGTPVDAALDGPPSLDASERLDASADASTRDAADANEACDECGRGDQQCGPLPPVCTYDDAGIQHCGSPGPSIWTCVVGDAGCAVWEKGLACRPDVPCCVPCMFEFGCPLGGPGNPCEQDTDCAFDACDPLLHECVIDQCSDRRQDGEESDVDCGGQFCGPCLVGQRCQSNFDCQSGHLCGASHLCE